MKLSINHKERAMALYGIDIGYVTVLLDGDPVMSIISVDTDAGLLTHVVGADDCRYALNGRKGTLLLGEKIGKIEILLKADRYGEWPHGRPRTECRIIGNDPGERRNESKRVAKSWRDARAKRRKRADAGSEGGGQRGRDVDPVRDAL